MITTIIFDWGDTIMREFDFPGPMFLWPKVEWIPGAEALLKILENRYTCCIATSAEHSNSCDMKKALGRVGADKFFKHFFSAHDIGFSKPDPMFFRSIISKLNAEPTQCVAVGNLYEKDVKSAKSSGMITVYFNERKLEGHFPDADYIIHSMPELKNILEKLG